MELKKFDHVNVVTSNLQEMVDWYGRILGMKTGPRPDFNIGGAWLYLGDDAIVHLVELKKPRQALEPRLEHFAFTANGMAEFLERLKGENIPYTLDPVPGYPIVQVNLADHDGNHIHVDFHKDEAVGLT